MKCKTDKEFLDELSINFPPKGGGYPTSEDILNANKKEKQTLRCTSDKRIARVFRSQYLLDLVLNKENTLRAVPTWLDDWEMKLFKDTTLDYYGEQVCFGDTFQNFYGQCWSYKTQENCEKWKEYSYYNDGVLVISTYNKLLESFFDLGDGRTHEAYLMKPVEYDGEANLLSRYSSVLGDFSTPREVSYLGLFTKRESFKWEDEVRIVYDDSAATKKRGVGDNSKHELLIHPNELIDKVIADPRMKHCDFKDFKKEMESNGIDSKKIKKSKLSLLPNFILSILLKNK